MKIIEPFSIDLSLVVFDGQDCKARISRASPLSLSIFSSIEEIRADQQTIRLESLKLG